MSPGNLDKDTTTLVGGNGAKSAISGGSANPQPDRDPTSDYDREKLQERLAKLIGGVAVIKVGAATEVELKRRRPASKTPSRAPGGCGRGHRRPAVASRCCAPWFKLATLKLTGDQGMGVEIIKKALEEPPAPDRQQRRRGRFPSSSNRVKEEARATSASTPPPASSATWWAFGVIDPAKVTQAPPCATPPPWPR